MVVFLMILRKSRLEVNNTSWNEKGRDRYKTKWRNYMLGSFFSNILTALTDPKDSKALKIKADPSYISDSEWKSRIESS